MSNHLQLPQLKNSITQQIDLGDYRITLDRYGDFGPPVLLLHGIPGWRGTWAKVAAGLAAGRRVIVPDLLGFGQSDEPRGDYHAKGQAAMLLKLLDALTIEQAHVVGFDFGGPIAVTMYHLAPYRLLSLALINTNLFTNTLIPGPLKLAKVPILGDLLFRLLFGKLGLSLLWWAVVADKKAFPRSTYQAALQWPNGVHWTRRVFLASMRDLPGLYRPVEETLPQIYLPSLVAWGDRDPFFSLAQGQRTAAAIPGAHFVRFAEAGHFVPEERPLELVDHLKELFQR